MTVTLVPGREFGMKASYVQAWSHVDQTMGFDALRLRDGSKLIRLACTAFVVVLIGGCGASPGGGVPVVSPPTGALVAWQAFPADRVPRPIVLIGGFSPAGFSTTPLRGFSPGDGKLAAICNKFALGIQLPTEVPNLAVASWPDGTSVTYPAISVTEAYTAMRSAPTEQTGCDSVAPLVITGARLGTAGFGTDRGTAQMSAWLFSATGALGELGYPAVTRSAFWGGASTGSASGGATVSRDGLSLTFGFVGAPAGNGPCDANYTGVVAESRSAVAVAVQMIPSQPQSGPVACTAIGVFRTVTVSLARPLDGRVVVDASGSAVSVCPAGLPAASPGFGSPAC
jgi:hypothetical protein